MMNFKLFIFLLFGITVCNFSVKCEHNGSVFTPTNEWQTVKKGQPIPSGLHVRHNFQTGVTEAKLMEKDEKNAENVNEKKEKSLSLYSKEGLPDAANELVLSIDELKARLKKIKLESEDNASGHSEEVKKAFKSYEELKEDFRALDMNITTDSDILTGIFEKFRVYEKSLNSGILLKSEVDGILQIFGDLEFLLHQIDNAQLFADLGGMQKIISPCLNITNDDVKIEALIVLGTAVQLNPKVQLKAMNNELVQKLLHILTVNNQVTLQSRCMFALGALVRQFPSAQKVLIDHGGLEIFGKILDNGKPKIQMRIMKLITDLAIERDGITNNDDDENLKLRKTREYGKTNFHEKLKLHNYCKYLSNLLTKDYSNELMTDEFLEILLDNMIILGDTCKNEFIDNEFFSQEFINKLIQINRTKEKYIMNDEEKKNYNNLLDKILKLKSIVFNDPHDEL